jgi:asparagine synthase (glutamine-hydrolysing)
MCGIAGLFVRPDAAGTPPGLQAVAGQMGAALRHRGPDDDGIWTEVSAGIALGFRRLAILDLSATGHQPMVSHSGRYVLVFNGEIYNYRQLRAALGAGCRLRGTSDTEVLLSAIEQWGVLEAVERAAGMFAFALWDRDERTLTLGRDRLGIKPLFVGRVPGGLGFASELKALRQVPGFDRTADLEAVAAYLRYLYVPEPRSIYRDAFRLAPGHLLTIRDPLDPPAPAPFWSLAAVAAHGLAEPFRGDGGEATEALTDLLHTVIDEHMASDVPLGAFLSGGVDSSVVTALMQARHGRPVKTYCIGFDDPVHNEAAHAAEVAAHLGTEHHEIMVTGQDALRLVPAMAEIFDEPYADVSQIPAALVCKLARQEVTVALSGEGGDEVFGGYNRYTYAAQTFRRVGRIPGAIRPALGRLLALPSPGQWDRLLGLAGPVLPSRWRPRLAGEKLAKIAALLPQQDDGARYRSLVSAWPQPAELLRSPPSRPWDPMAEALEAASPHGLLPSLILADQRVYLPGDQLARADRVSMAASLELRVPLVDHRVVELSWRIPMEQKIREGVGKRVLREVLYRYVPQALVERPKVGFSVPLAAWLSGPLREWSGDLLAPEAVARGGVLDPGRIARAWARFQAGRTELGPGIWALLMLRAWEEHERRPLETPR